MKTSEVLVKARELISKPEGWTKGSFARDCTGKDVPSSSDDAVCFCSVGAINNVLKGAPYEISFRIHNYFGTVIHSCNVTRWNDDHTHQQVLDGFDAAIVAARKDEI